MLEASKQASGSRDIILKKQDLENRILNETIDQKQVNCRSKKRSAKTIYEPRKEKRRKKTFIHTLVYERKVKPERAQDGCLGTRSR